MSSFETEDANGHPCLRAGFFLLTDFVGLKLLQSSFTGFCPLENILQRRSVARKRSPTGA